MTSRKDVPDTNRRPRVAADLNAPRVLVLNASYEPLHVTSAKRAITLVQYGVAEILEDSDDRSEEHTSELQSH